MTIVIETKTNEHTIPSILLEKTVRITVVGCGGTGSAVASGLPYLHQAMLALGHPGGLDVTFVDGDRISRINCVRQPFSESEVGLHKATVLATRLNLFWGLGWKGTPQFLDEGWREETDIVIGCVDSRKARYQLLGSPAYWNSHYCLDLVNNPSTCPSVLCQPANNNTTEFHIPLPPVTQLTPKLI